MNRKETIEEKLSQYFGGSLVNMGVKMVGALCSIEVVYYDFLPVRDVRRWIDDNIQDVLNISIDRTYSETAITQALMDIYSTDIDLQIRVEEELFGHTFPNNVEDSSKEE